MDQFKKAKAIKYKFTCDYEYEWLKTAWANDEYKQTIILFYPHLQTPVCIFRMHDNDTQTEFMSNLYDIHREIDMESNLNDPDYYVCPTEHQLWKGGSYLLTIETINSSWSNSGYLEIITIPLMDDRYHQQAKFPLPDAVPQERQFYTFRENYGLIPNLEYANYISQIPFENIESYQLKNLSEDNGSIKIPLPARWNDQFKMIKQDGLKELLFDRSFDTNFEAKAIKIHHHDTCKINFKLDATLYLVPKITSELVHFTKDYF